MAFAGVVKVEEPHATDMDVEVKYEVEYSEDDNGSNIVMSLRPDKAKPSTCDKKGCSSGQRSKLNTDQGQHAPNSADYGMGASAIVSKQSSDLKEEGLPAKERMRRANNTDGISLQYLDRQESPFVRYGENVPGSSVRTSCLNDTDSVELHKDVLLDGHTVTPSFKLNQQPYTCGNCKSGFISAMDLWDHRRICGIGSDFPCKICGKYFGNRTSLRKHQYIHTDEKKFLCTECGMRFNSNGNLKRHMRTHTGERPYKCEVCEKSFAQVTTLKNHLTTHTNDRPFECEVCKKRFPRKGHLTGHMGTHIDFHGGIGKMFERRSMQGEKGKGDGFQYRQGDSFSFPPEVAQNHPGQSDLDFSHSVRFNEFPKTGSENSTFTVVSEKNSISKDNSIIIEVEGVEEQGTLQQGNDAQSERTKGPIGTVGSNPSDNNNIPQGSTLKSNVQRDLHKDIADQSHLVSTGTEKPITYSGMTQKEHDDAYEIHLTPQLTPYGQGSGFQTTTKISSDDTVIVGTIYTSNHIVNVKHFRCNICGKILTSSNHLKEHKLIHTGGRPHQCSFCSKSFRNSGNLRRHERTHTGVRPYKCKLCDKSFTQAGTLKNHMYSHTKLKPFLCYECGEGFTRNRTLKDHIRAVHAKERPFACPFCNHRTFRQDRLTRHIDSIHGGEKGYMCSTCGRYYKIIKSLQIHRHKHKIFRPDRLFRPNSRLLKSWQMQKQDKLMYYACKSCNLKFSSNVYLQRHRKSHYLRGKANKKVGNSNLGSSQSGNMSRDDDYSDLKIKNLENEVAKLKDRIIDHKDSTSNGTLTCRNCQAKCAPSGCFGRFLSCHKCTLLLSCTMCTRPPLLPTFLDWHTKVRHRKPPPPVHYTCGCCDKVFSKPANFILHRQFHDVKFKHLIKPKLIPYSALEGYQRKYQIDWSIKYRYTCGICAKQFIYLSKLKQHEKDHNTPSTKKPLRDARTCHVCNQRFTHVGALYSHMKTHISRQDRPHKCTRCHKRFLRPSHLKEHMLRHYDKQFSCTSCSKLFYTSRSLRRHEEKQHKRLHCEVCKQEFSLASEKESHLQSHRYKTCYICKTEFKTKAELDDHVVLCGKEEMLYLCQICGDSFGNLDTLASHQKTHACNS